jgi:hypothetical protein
LTAGAQAILSLVAPRSKQRAVQEQVPPPPELLQPEADRILDLDGEAYLRWLETGEGEDPCRDSYD